MKNFFNSWLAPSHLDIATKQLRTDQIALQEALATKDYAEALIVFYQKRIERNVSLLEVVATACTDTGGTMKK